MSTRNYFSRTFKLHVLQEVARGKLTKEEARLKYGIKGHSAILNWQRDLAMDNLEVPMNSSENTKHDLESELEIKKLKKELSDAKFKLRAFEIYIQELEKETKGNLVKKSVTGQLIKSEKKQ